VLRTTCPAQELGVPAVVRAYKQLKPESTDPPFATPHGPAQKGFIDSRGSPTRTVARPARQDRERDGPLGAIRAGC